MITCQHAGFFLISAPCNNFKSKEVDMNDVKGVPYSKNFSTNSAQPLSSTEHFKCLSARCFGFKASTKLVWLLKSQIFPFRVGRDQNSDKRGRMLGSY